MHWLAWLYACSVDFHNRRVGERVILKCRRRHHFIDRSNRQITTMHLQFKQNTAQLISWFSHLVLATENWKSGLSLLPWNIKTRNQRHHTTLTAKPLKYWVSFVERVHEIFNIYKILTYCQTYLVCVVCYCVSPSEDNPWYPNIAEDNWPLLMLKRALGPVSTKILKFLIRGDCGRASVKTYEK